MSRERVVWTLDLARTRPSARTCAAAASAPPFPNRSTGRRSAPDAASGPAGRPPDFDPQRYRQRNVVERCINKLKESRAVATRYDKREYVYRGTVTVASIRIWLKDPVPDPQDWPQYTPNQANHAANPRPRTATTPCAFFSVGHRRPLIPGHSW
jgi:transposase